MQEMGRYQRAETVGIFTAIGTIIMVALATYVYTSRANAIWLVTARRIIITSVFLGICAAVVFVLGYTRKGFGSQKKTFARLIRRALETVSLAIVYAVSIGLISAAVQGFIAQLLGREFTQYQLSIVMCIAGIIGYIVYVQAVLINSRTIASLLPGFVISGVTLAGMMSDDPNWWRNNFSQLGDRTTFAAGVFNFTVVLTGVTMLIISYFALSELTTQNRLFEHDFKREATREFQIRRGILAALLIMASVMFMGIGIFRYSPHPILHNVFARGIAIPMTLLMIGMPWLVKRFSRSFYFVSDFILAVIAVSYIYWYTGRTSLTNVEALAVILFMGWFILFSRQIAALEADRFEALATLPENIVHEVGHARLDLEQ
ncbi:ABC transporter permease [Alloscardovia theropitheci]|uniref:ABC transporter permease n=1 Tax=Alloscardovia theropitheci TaxID=2496842 RepID=A0A4R0R169_9BIFI|nr:ABC transporter permease [Alloscardovia theropitheci]TCD54866.1 ABC transporter permease [Alloscardovia theropitheci]